MSRPSFQFYPADWRNNANLRRSSLTSRGAWMDILCLLHDADEYGVLRWSLADIARAANVPLKWAAELADKGVLKGSDGQVSDYIFEPFHAGKRGAPVVLIAANEGPCWYSSRLVRDEYIRQRRGAETRFTPQNQPSPKVTPTRAVGDGEGDGPSSSSSSSSPESKKEDTDSESVDASTRDPKSRPHRATRWPTDGVVSEDWRQAASIKRAEHGLAQIDMDLEAERFANYWGAKSGAQATKVDWRMTWINWALKAEKPRNGNGRATPHDNFAAGAYLAAKERR